MKSVGEFIPGRRGSIGSHEELLMIHMHLLGGLFPLPYLPNMADNPGNHQGRQQDLNDPQLIIVFSADPFKLSYPLTWLTVILVWAGSSWLQVNLDRLRL